MKSIKQIISSVGFKLYYYCCPDKIYLNNKFKQVFGRDIDWKNPTTFNEKLQWLKIYDRNPLYTQLVDKYEVRKYIAKIIGEEYLIPCLGVWDRFEDIDFNTLPEQFVLKCTHDSHSVIICKDKATFDVEAARKSLTEHLKRNFYYNAREWPYKNVKPRIIAEQYMFECNDTKELRDYKFFCMNGQVKFFKIDFNREIDHHANYYDIDGNLLPFEEVFCPPDKDKKLEIPVQLKKMIALAENLSKDIPFLRVDFYSLSEADLRFGELTFYPGAGFGKFTPDEDDMNVGKLLHLADKWGRLSGGKLDSSFPSLQVNCFRKSDAEALTDYKYFCFDGKPKFMYISNDAGIDPRTDFFDMEFNHLPFRMKDPVSNVLPSKPKRFEDMKRMAEVLSEGFPHLRVDFYVINEQIYIGELTFYHSSGFSKVNPPEWDRIIGEYIKLPK